MQQKETVRKAKGISLRLVIVAGVFLLALLAFGFIADEMVLENESSFDRVVFGWFSQITSSATTSVMLVITFFGSSYFLFPAYILLIVYYLIFKKNRKLSLDVAAVGITSTIILFSLKAIFRRHRPMDPLIHSVNGFSFPSGHSFSSFTFFGLLIYIIWNQPMNSILRWVLTVFFFLFACAIAISRVYLHVHFASDVIAGFCLCIIWLSITLWLLKKFDRKTAAHPAIA
jgi:membrane-associated phospholipid phosphatase